MPALDQEWVRETVDEGGVDEEPQPEGSGLHVEPRPVALWDVIPTLQPHGKEANRLPVVPARSGEDRPNLPGGGWS